MGIKIGLPKVVEMEASTLHIRCKVVDEFTAHIADQHGDVLGGQDDGYVPDFMPGDHYGDYVILDIDLATGLIKNWKTPTAEQIAAFVANAG